MKNKSILIIAGEESAERYGAELIKEFKNFTDEYRFFGTGGQFMRDSGMEILFDVNELSFIGIFEVITQIGKIWKIKKRMEKEIERRKPALSILIDFPDFNLMIAKKLKKYGIPVVYYISPTIWAWRRRRLNKIKKYVDLMLLIFPFEAEIYEKEKIKHKYIGHPLVSRVVKNMTDSEFRKNFNILDRKKVISILPGSRMREVKYHLPVIVEAVKMLKKEFDIETFLILARNIDKEYLNRYLNEIRINIVKDKVYDVMGNSDLIIASCGTSNLEALLLEIPLIVVYKVMPISYLLGRKFVKIDKFSIVNILAGKEIIPELIQTRLTPGNIYNEALKILRSQDKIEEMKTHFREIKEKLGYENASKIAVEEIYKFLK
ncbi:MAG: lipid-A-disaccharide synthase [Acidobacteriota bacterium]